MVTAYDIKTEADLAEYIRANDIQSMFGTTKVHRVRLREYEPDNWLSSPWCKERAGQTGVVVGQNWGMARVLMSNGDVISVTYESLEELE